MADELLKIKTSIPPLCNGVLPRLPLYERLDEHLQTAEGFTRQLTLLSAPAGSGKTTLIRSWLQTHENEVGWLSLGKEDSNRERFWIYLIKTLQTLKQDLGEISLSMVQWQAHGQNEPSSFLTPLLNDLFDLKHPVFLVLDDYHYINNNKIQEDMLFFLENLPTTVHLILATRSDPPWPLTKWRARGSMTELRLDSLKFSQEETRLFLAKRHVPELKETHLQTLYQKTEGWIAGLQLIAISLANSIAIEEFIENFTGNNRHIFFFLSEEIFQRQSTRTQEFLLTTSPLERFSAPLCNAITQRDDSHEVLAELERDNLFILPLDGEGTWYRYHHLFADFLFHKLKERAPETIHTVHNRASKWFVDNHEPGEGIHHALSGHNFEKAGEILHTYYEHILRTKEPGFRSRTLDLLPSAVLKTYPRLLAHKALFDLQKGGMEIAEQSLALAEDVVISNTEEQKEFSGLLAAVKMYYHIHCREFNKAFALAKKAMHYLPEDPYWSMSVAVFSGDAYVLKGRPGEALPLYQKAHAINLQEGNLYLALSTGAKLAFTFISMGQLQEAEEHIDETLHSLQKKGSVTIPRAGSLYALQGELHRERGDLEKGRQCLEHSLSLSESEKPSWAWNLLFKVALSFSQGAFHKTLRMLKTLEALHETMHLPPFVIFPAMVWRGKVFLKMGEMKKARELLQKAGIGADKPIQPGQEEAFLLLCRPELYDIQEPHIVQKHLHQIEERARQGNHHRLLVETGILKAFLAEHKGNPREAETFLKEALYEGYRASYFQIFVDEGKKLLPLLKRILKKETNKKKKQYMLGIAEARPLAEEDSILPHEAPSSQKLVETLTPRELEILHLISRGLSNAHISKELSLSPNTIKWYNSNIFGKLGVKNRTEAIAEARRLHLLP